jgi:radical SAM protein with 4Fe4S-binding SPASM domain
MFCPVTQRKFSDFSFSIDNAAIEKRLPYMGALELTYRCNQACRHCYCNLSADDSRRTDEMPAQAIKRVLDEAADAGCFWLLMTGGEVLLREDFWDIYMHALRKGMLVEVFTNATLIDEEAARRFAEYPPLGIDVSIYGSSPRLHDMITQVGGSFKNTMAGIEWLRRYKVRFSLKTILMTLNHTDLAGMRALAQGLETEFRYDALVAPRTDGGLSPVTYRLSAEAMAALDIDEDYESCDRIFNGFWNKKPAEALTCGAGVFAFNINPYGYLSPCTMFRSFQYPLAGVGFADAWQRLIRDHDARQSDFIPTACRTCSMLLICSNCPAWDEIEAKGINTKVDYICEYARCLEKKYFEKKEAMRHGEKVLSETGD